MSGYIIEEPDETPVYYNTTTKKEIIEYWRLYSPIQRKRFTKVLNQMKDIWYDVYDTIKFIRDNNAITLNDCNDLMLKVHRLFIIKLKNKIEYYKEEKMIKRRQKNYLSKKINKLKTTKNKV